MPSAGSDGAYTSACSQSSASIYTSFVCSVPSSRNKASFRNCHRVRAQRSPNSTAQSAKSMSRPIVTSEEVAYGITTHQPSLGINSFMLDVMLRAGKAPEALGASYATSLYTLQRKGMMNTLSTLSSACMSPIQFAESASYCRMPVRSRSSRCKGGGGYPSGIIVILRGAEQLG
ncbi:hypothetical protein OE88DRAFT_1647694 [Heliocybe sulcata]|uniref:Uncharacterized protein n=1 Tax=Heliocybe sulcata TaxID=5364 RepID=A0A5C3MQ63_9AGAM|nr:hypothetical protein OE88DRAFT_1647694 [Heliocybe sulcata]